jgi:hypothetical protein
MLSWIFIVLVYWNNSPRVDMWPHSDTLSWIRANPSLLVLLSDACLAEKQQIPILKSLVCTDRYSNPRSIALEENMLTITPSMRLKYDYKYVRRLLASNNNWTIVNSGTKNQYAIIRQLELFIQFHIWPY